MVKTSKISLLFASLALSFGASAQEGLANSDAPAKKIGYGALLGANASYFTQEATPVGAKLGVTAGGFVNYQALNFLAVQLEVAYMELGGKELSVANSSNYSGSSSFSSPPYPLPNDLISQETSVSKVTFHNLEIPLLFKFTYPGLGSALGIIQPHLLVGPSLGLNFAATSNSNTLVQFSNGSEMYVQDRESISPNNNYGLIQWGAYFGGGIEAQLKSFILTIDLRYRLALNPLQTNYGVASYVDGLGNTKSNSVALIVGIGFGK